MNSRAVAALVLLGAVFSASCQPAEHIPTYPLAPAPQTLASLRNRTAQIRDVSSQGTLRMTRPDGQSVMLDAAVVLQTPQKARIRAWKFGQAVFDLTVIPDGIYLVAPQESSSREQIARGGNGAGKMIRTWLGLLTSSLDSGDSTENGNELIVRRSQTDGTTLVCTIDRPTITPRSYRLLDQSGKERFAILLDRYVESSGQVWPRRIQAISETGKMEIKLSDVEINGGVPDGAFVPPGARGEASMTLLEAVNFPARRPITALVILVALTVAAVLGVRGLKPDVSLQGMMSSRDASAVALDRVFNDFAAVDELLVMASLPDSAPADPDRLIRFAGQLEEAIAKDPAAAGQVTAVRYRPDPKTRDFFQSVFAPNGMFYLSDEEYAQARQRLTRAGMVEQFQRNEQLIATPGPAAGALSKAFLQDPLRLHEYMLSRLSGFGGMEHFGAADALLSTDQRSLLIRIRGAKPPGDLEFAKEMTASVSRAVQKANTDGLEIDLSGAYAIAAHSATAIRRDSIISVNTSVICMAILFLLVYRKPLRLFAIAMVPVAMGILYGFGVYAMLRPTITPLTAVIGGALAGIGIDYSIHYLTFYDSRRHLGRSALESTAATIRTMGTLQLAGWATSVVGFVATALSTVKALRDFALAGSLGLAGVFICTLVMHPAILVLVDRGRSSMAASRLDLTRIVRWAGRNGAIVIGACCLLMVIPLAWLIRDRSVFDLESDMTILHPRPNPPLDAQKKISQRMGTSPDTLLVYLKADTSEKLVELAHDVQARLTSPEAKTAGVSGAFGLATVLPDPRLAARRIAETGPEYAEQVLADFDAVVADSVFSASAFQEYRDFLKILLTQTKPPGLDALEPYTEIRQTLLPRDGPPAQATQAVTLLFIGDSLDTRVSRERVLAVLRSQLHDLPGVTLTGIAVINQDMDATIRHDLPWLIGAAVILVGVYLVAQFRSIADTFLALLPVMFSLSCVLGVMELTCQRLNLANIVAVPLLIGIDVDYGIFLVGVARRSHDRDELVADLSTISQGIVLCASTALLGFGAIYFTSVPAIQSLGLAVSVGIISCMMGSILLLTPILLLRGPRAAMKVN